MKIFKFSGIFVLLILLWHSPGYSVERFQMSADFTSGFPQGEFRQNVSLSHDVRGK